MLSTLVIAIVFLHIDVIKGVHLLESHDYPEPRIFLDWPWRETNTLVYARCNESQPVFGKRCIARLQLNAFQKESKNTICEVILEPETPQKHIEDKIIVQSFGKDKILFVWLETQNISETKSQILKTQIVYMLDKCWAFTTKVYTFPGNSVSLGGDKPCKHVTVVTFENTYHVIVMESNNSEQTIESECTGPYSIYKFDDRGRKISGPENWPNAPWSAVDGYSFISAVEPRQAEKGYFVVNQHHRTFIADLMFKESCGYGKIRLWKSLPNESYWYSYKFTITNEAIGMCYICKNSSYVCWQSTQEGVINIQKLFTIESSQETRLSNVYNTRNGEILSIAEIIYRSDAKHQEGTNDRFYLTKINQKGLIETLEVQYDSKCNLAHRAHVRIFKNEADQYCVGRICHSTISDHGEPTHIDTSVRCYSKNVFAI